MNGNHEWLLCRAKLIYQGKLLYEKIHSFPLDGLFEFARYVISLHENDSNYISDDGLVMYDINDTERINPIINANDPSPIYNINGFTFEAIYDTGD